MPVPLRVHGHDTSAEIKAAFGVLSTDAPWIHHAARGSRLLLYRYAEACGYVRELRKQDGRAGAPTEPSRCLGFATYESLEGERPMAWGSLCGGLSVRSRRRGCQAVAWHRGGGAGLRGVHTEKMQFIGHPWLLASFFTSKMI
jgi:hypothetical protein